MLLVFLHLIGLAVAAGAAGAQGRALGSTPARAPLLPDAGNATGDRLHAYIEGELARRMAAALRRPEPDLGRRILNISEIYLEDEEMYDWIPEVNETRVQYTRRVIRRPSWHNQYHTNYVYKEPPDEEAINRMHSAMRDKLYRSRELIDQLMPQFDQYKDSLKLRFAFVFRRLDNLLDEMAAINAHMYHWRDFWHVMRCVFYHQHMIRRHIDVVYIVERTIGMYMWYKERERRLNSVLAERMQTEANYAK